MNNDNDYQNDNHQMSCDLTKKYINKLHTIISYNGYAFRIFEEISFNSLPPPPHTRPPPPL